MDWNEVLKDIVSGTIMLAIGGWFGGVIKGQKLRYVKDFHGKEVLWILSPEQIEMPGMIFVGGYPDEYCIFMDTLSDDEQKKIRKQLN